MTVMAASGSGASLHMNGGTGFIFNLVFDTTLSATEQTIVLPGNGTVPAVYSPSGNTLQPGDQLLYVLVTDSTGAAIGTILPNAIGSRSSNAVLQADGSMGANGLMVGNTGTINFWFNGFVGTIPPTTSSYIMANKVWLNADGTTFIGATPPLSLLLNGSGTTPGSTVSDVPMLPGVPVLVQDGTYTVTEPNIPGFQLIDITSSTMQTDIINRNATAVTSTGNYTVTFTNISAPNSTSLILVGEKTASGLPAPGNAFRPGIFQFTATDMSTGQVVATATNTINTVTPPTASGSIVFTPIIYSASDVGRTFTYLIEEIDIGNPDWTTSTSTFTVTVSVTLSGNDIIATPTYPPPSGIVFNNAYNVGTASFQPFARKQIIGSNVLLNNQFSFAVIDTGNNNEVVSTGTNIAGTPPTSAIADIIFTPINYTYDSTPGYYPRVYNYAIIETTPGGNGWSVLSGVPNTLTVTVSNPAGTTLTVSAVPAPDPIVITNRYVAGGVLSLNAHKTTSGGTLTAGQFQFQITDEFGNYVTSGQNDANGNIVFGTIRFNNNPGSIGFHMYTLTETSTSGGGWATSSVSYPVLVRVSDNGNGTLAVNTFNLNTDNFVFVNTYGSSGSVVLNATKLANGGTLTNGQFQFAVQNESGVTVATGTNNAAGNITFSPIQYTNNDIGMHHYTIYETSPIITVPGSGGYDVGMWTPSPLVYHVSVNVVDNGDGTITATPIYPRMGLNFINTYTNYTDPVGSIALWATKSTVGAPMVGGEFSFAVVETVGGNDIVVATGTNDSNGHIQFSAIPYTVYDKGTHSYKVIETTPVAPYWQTDSAAFDVSVDVLETTYPPDSITPGARALLCLSAYPPGGMYFTNNYAPPDRMLSITKTIEGFQGFNVFDPNSISPITFLVVGTNAAGAEVYRETVAFNSTNFQWNPNLKNYTYIMHNLPLGSYRVYERGGFAPGYVNNRPNPPQSATVTDTVPASVAFLNSYTLAPVPPANHPAVTINKVFHGLRDAEIPADFTIMVTGPGGYSRTLSLSEVMSGSGGLLTNLAQGTYSISERNNNVPGYIIRVTANGLPISLPYSFQVSQTTGHIMLTIDNNYMKREQSPQTGVTHNLFLPVIMLLISITGFISAEIYRRKKKKT